MKIFAFRTILFVLAIGFSGDLLLTVSIAQNSAADAGSLIAAATTNDGTLDSASQLNQADRIEKLIAQLGDTKFSARQRAERELLELGSTVFDQLKNAEGSHDPEIAARAKYLSRKLIIEWTSPEDAPQVRKLMENYGSSDKDTRQMVIYNLHSLKQSMALPILCRIARYDQSELLSRNAALGAIRLVWINSSSSVQTDGDISDDPIEDGLYDAPTGEPSGNPLGNNSKVSGKGLSTEPENKAYGNSSYKLIENSLGKSGRISVTWLRTFLLQRSDPQAALLQWQGHTKALRQEGSVNYVEHTQSLMRLQTSLLDSLGRETEYLALWEKIVELDESESNWRLKSLIQELIEKKKWKAIEQINSRFQNRFEKNPSLLYAVAEMYDVMEESEKAQQTADKAFHFTSQPEKRLDVARQIAIRGKFKWAEREYQKVIDTVEDTDAVSFRAITMLSALYYDQERFREAADVLQEFLEKSKKSSDFRKAMGKEGIDYVTNRYEYYLARQLEKDGDAEELMKHLEKAYQKAPDDIDVLISMYRVKNADEKYKEKTMQRIQTAAKNMDQALQMNPNDTTTLNNWAWLISNTKGDYKLAIERATKASQLAGPRQTASYIDTLARCYYADGDFQNAVMHQKRAVKLEPHTQQLQRQLRQFEKELKEKQAEEKSTKAG